MDAFRFVIILLAFCLFMPHSVLPADDQASSSDAEPVSALQPENVPNTRIEVLSEEDLTRLLDARVTNQPSGTFGPFANMFLVSSRIQLGIGTALVTQNRKIAVASLQSPYPETYHPTMRELLDLIALETSSKWKYEPSGKFLNTDKRLSKPVKGLAIFEFAETVREKPYKIDVAKGWTVRDKGNWVMYVPPDFPVGMDIYEAGTYSTDNKREEKEFLEQVRIDVALMWALRANANATLDDLKPAKIGQFDALFYETLLSGKDGRKFRWRHWVFLDGHKCYFVVSTIPPAAENDIYPDVERMLRSFEVKGAAVAK